MMRTHDSWLKSMPPNDRQDIFPRSKIISRSVKVKSKLKHIGTARAYGIRMTHNLCMTYATNNGACKVCVSHINVSFSFASPPKTLNIYVVSRFQIIKMINNLDPSSSDAYRQLMHMQNTYRFIITSFRCKCDS